MNEFKPLKEISPTLSEERIVFNAMVDAEITYRTICNAHSNDLISVFGTCCVEDIVNNHSVFALKEAVDNISCLKRNNEIHVGDVVSDKMKLHRDFIVTRVDDGVVDGIDDNGTTFTTIVENCVKTGKSNPTILEILCSLRRGE